jgi:imidazolonepropionase-like amidohydrolase
MDAVLGRARTRLSTPLLATSLLLLSASIVSAQSFAVRQVRVFDGNQVQTGMTVVVRDGIIASVQAGTAIPPGVEVIDGNGRTLLPGLFDSHGHMYGNALTQALAFGVTTVLDMFTRADFAAERREEQRKGLATGRADLLSAGLLVTAPGAHGTQYGIEISTITAPEEAAAAVKTRLAQGSDYIKIIYRVQACKTGCPSIDSATMRAVITETHRRGRKAVVHVDSLEDARTAIQAGADGIVHLFTDREADADFLTLITERKAFVVPTLSIIAAWSGSRDAGSLVAHPAFSQYLSGHDLKRLVTGSPRYAMSLFDAAAASMTMLAGRGVPILAGSDPPNTGTAWGASMHRELALMVTAGLSPTEALKAATSVPAHVFGLHDRGRIAPGLRADLLLVEGDPTTDILATRNIVGIWKQGARFDREAYRKALLEEGQEIQEIRRRETSR